MKAFLLFILLVIIFGIPYFGINYFFSSRANQNEPLIITGEQGLRVKELKSLHEEMAVLEQKIQFLRDQDKPYAEEENAVNAIKGKIENLRVVIAEHVAVPGKGGQSPAANMMPEGFLSDKYQRVFLSIITSLVILVIVLFIITKVKSGPNRPLTYQSVQMKQAKQPQKAAGQADLKDTLEKFEAQPVQLQDGSAQKLDIEAVKEQIPEKDEPFRQS